MPTITQAQTTFIPFRIISSVIAALFLLPSVAVADEAPRYGLWVEAEGKNQPFVSKEAFEGYLEFTDEKGLTDLYCQVYRGGRSWFPSMVADDTPYRQAAKEGFDPLGDSIKVAHARGQKVHAWINALRITRNFKAPILTVVGRDAVLQDNYGNSLLDYDEKGRPPGAVGKYFRLGTPGLWLDPSSQAVRNYLIAVVEDVLRRYPDIDGIHLDMIRFPYLLPVKPSSRLPGGVDLGYSPRAIRSFLQAGSDLKIQYLNLRINSKLRGEAEPKATLNQAPVAKERVLPPGELPSGDEWDSWRRSQVTLLVFEIREHINRIAPGKEFSAAVLAWPDRAYLSAFQDWRGWLVGGIVDTVVPMNYTTDDRLAHYASKQSAVYRSSGEILVGLGAWLKLKNHNSLIRQVKSAMKEGNHGVVLFSFANMYSANGKNLLRRVAESLLVPGHY